VALLSLIFGEKQKARIGVVELDAALSETHSKEALVTDHPVEFGADVSDHIRRLPDSVEINGIVSNTPLVFLSAVTESPTRAEDAYEELRRIMDEGELVTVATTLREYSNMALTNLAVARDAASGNVMNATMSLREIIIAETQTVEAPVPAAAANSKPVNQGKQAAKPANAAQAAKSQSILSSVGEALFGG